MATLERAFGAALKEQRLKRKMTQRQLAERSELDETYVSLLERGKRQPSLKALLALAEGLGVSPIVILNSTLKKLKLQS